MAGLMECYGPEPPPGEIHLLRTDDNMLTCVRADPVVWFAVHTLDMLRREPDHDPGWTFDGEYVRLQVDNGRWVWKLTGRTWTHHYGPGTMDLVMAEGKWPD